MVTNFEEITQDLTEYEKQTLLPILVKGFSTKIGAVNAVTNATIVKTLKDKGYKINDVSVRKLVHFIRVNGFVERLISTNKGYYISNDEAELKSYVTSLNERINSIKDVCDAVEDQLYNFIFKQPKIFDDAKK